MKSVVIGTAGHVDHGKTALVKALTGIDTDRLDEEKRRGMTIELGFAHMELPGGISASIVDVPGHERFVRTMVAGAYAVDLVLLIIAADEGVMPQTREHIDILNLLGVKRCIVVLTKVDLADSEMLEIVKEEIADVLRGTPYEGAPLAEVSAVTGEGLDKLLSQIETEALAAGHDTTQQLFRLPVDRSFISAGYGTVVTGTVAGASISKGEEVEILPEGLKTRVRGIQVHGGAVDTTYAGQRCALNLAGVDKEKAARGCVIARPGTLVPGTVADVVLHAVKGSGGLKHGDRVHVHSGTVEVLARVRTIGCESIAEGQKGYAQLKFEEPVTVVRGDRYVVRSYSPVSTIGGGSILLHNAPLRSRFDSKSLHRMQLEENAAPHGFLSDFINASDTFYSLNELWIGTYIDREDINSIIKAEAEKGNIILLEGTGRIAGQGVLERIRKAAAAEFERLYAGYPYRYAMGKEELKSRIFESRIFGRIDDRDFNSILKYLQRINAVAVGEQGIYRSDVNMRSLIEQKSEVVQAEKRFKQAGLNPQSVSLLVNEEGLRRQDAAEITEFLLKTGKLKALDTDAFIHSDSYKDAVEVIHRQLQDNSSITVGEARDLLGTGRKTAVLLLEHLDTIGYTKRSGDVRVAGGNYGRM